ncbi:MAG: hypothetical protein ACRC06_10525 [Waterburya sp.]
MLNAIATAITLRVHCAMWRLRLRSSRRLSCRRHSLRYAIARRRSEAVRNCPNCDF